MLEGRRRIRSLLVLLFVAALTACGESDRATMPEATALDEAARLRAEGFARLAADDPAAASAPLERALSIDPDHAETRLALTRALIASGEPAAALRALDAGGSPERAEVAEVALLRGRALLALGRFEAAAAALGSALAARPGDGRLRCDLATALAESGRHEEAVAELSEALRGSGPDTDPGLEATTRYRLATSLRALGRGEEADAELASYRRVRDRLERVHRLERRVAQSDAAADWLRLGLALVAAGRERPAQRALAAAEERSAEADDVAAARALLDIAAGRPDAARRRLEARDEGAHGQEASRPAWRLVAARLAIARGDRGRARDELLAARAELEAASPFVDELHALEQEVGRD